MRLIMDKAEWYQTYIDDITEELVSCEKYLLKLRVYGSDEDIVNLKNRIKEMKKERIDLRKDLKHLMAEIKG